jgi:glycyl-tRNA synthetase beta chain
LHKVVGADPGLARRAAVLAKADLQTEVVGEFPELQGVMGRKYALLQGEDPSVAAAIEEHYKPAGPIRPRADRSGVDRRGAGRQARHAGRLLGHRREAHRQQGPVCAEAGGAGVIRIVVENGVRVSLRQVALSARRRITYFENYDGSEGGFGHGPAIVDERYLSLAVDLLAFFHDRLKVYLRDRGARHDLIDAVLGAQGARPISPRVGEMSAQPTEGGAVPPASQREDGRPTSPPSALPGISPTRGEIGQSPSIGQASTGKSHAPASANDDLLSIVRRVEALGVFLETEDGRNLLAGTKRAANILAAEEKKGTAVAANVEPALFREDAERALFEAVNQAERDAGQAIAAEDFSGAMRALSALREPVDSFFERVLVNDEDAAVRANRLALLSRIRAATGAVADFSKIAG